jgi:hypothetical protein
MENEKEKDQENENDHVRGDVVVVVETGVSRTRPAA